MAPPKMPSPQFELATIEVEKINGELSNDELLEVCRHLDLFCSK